MACLTLGACLSAPYPSGDLERLYPDPRMRPQLRTIDVDGHALHYAERVQSGTPRILFVHGSPGDWQGFADYLKRPELQAYGPLLAPDRPGYGGSDAHTIVVSLAEQARRMAGLLDGDGAPAIVVGHSLGGAIAARLAMDDPRRVRGLLLLAPSVAPELEAPRWYQRVADWRLMHWLLPRALVDSNDELLPLQGELRAMRAGWAELRMPVYVVQGMRDALVDPRTADFLEQALAHTPHRIIRYADAGHLLLWQEPDRVVAALQDLIRASAPDANEQQ
ncbi:alpha/beta fold hydrolase [Solimonas soli]|uniref:alpha/beta fold hydrolase n=1 Tax=Solimonas soli TaxID=413479 RepID=UPI00146FBB2B|nr:alpha/beta fold hydrolase [Solimonas soli]